MKDATKANCPTKELRVLCADLLHDPYEVFAGLHNIPSLGLNNGCSIMR
jgi:hypothetical protein